MGISLDITTGRLYVDGELYQLTVCEAAAARELLSGEVVCAAPHHEASNLRQIIQKLRRKTPLNIVTIGQQRGYKNHHLASGSRHAFPGNQFARRAIHQVAGLKVRLKGMMEETDAVERVPPQHPPLGEVFEQQSCRSPRIMRPRQGLHKLMVGVAPLNHGRRHRRAGA